MSAPFRISLTEVMPGMDLGEAVFGPITREDITRYAEASGDDNPIHQDEDYARSTGAPTVFAMGMLPAGYLAHAVSDWIGGPENLRRYKVRFTTRVWPGDEIVCRGRVVTIEDATITATVEASRRGDGPEGLGLPAEEVAIVGEIEAEIPDYDGPGRG
ncbi:MAG: MaoC/PaaZ C-terminal domain-containing protein [Actinomycetota bacterium]